MDLKKTALVAAGLFLVTLVWLRWWTRPERQIPRAQARLMAALESRNFEDVSRTLADDYRDRWQQDKQIVMERCQQVFGQFALLDIEREFVDLHGADERWELSEKVRLKGLGGPIAMAARDAVNALREPFTTVWHRRSWKPWDWELKSVEHPALELP
jgi:hypothetical protein